MVTDLRTAKLLCDQNHLLSCFYFILQWSVRLSVSSRESGTEGVSFRKLGLWLVRCLVKAQISAEILRRKRRRGMIYVDLQTSSTLRSPPSQT